MITNLIEQTLFIATLIKPSFDLKSVLRKVDNIRHNRYKSMTCKNVRNVKVLPNM